MRNESSSIASLMARMDGHTDVGCLCKRLLDTCVPAIANGAAVYSLPAAGELVASKSLGDQPFPTRLTMALGGRLEVSVGDLLPLSSFEGYPADLALTSPYILSLGAFGYLLLFPKDGVAALEAVRVLVRQAALMIENAQLKQALSRQSTLQEEFLSTLSHELRTPMNVILGWARILRGGQVSAEVLGRALDAMERCASQHAQTIESLLDYSQLTKGLLPLNIQTVAIADVVREAVTSAAAAAAAKGIEIRVSCAPFAGFLASDRERLHQIIWQLIANAVKFSPKGSTVHVSLERQASDVHLRVSDRGVGIAPEFLPYVFDHFRQEDASASRAYEGLGLGLAIVKALVELHGGRISASSEGPGSGATFTLVFPLKVLALADLNSAQRAPRKTRQLLAGIRVLVVDDAPDARRLLGTVLRRNGALVTTVGTVAEAIERLLSEKPDVLVSDIGMPEEDGFALIRKVKALEDQLGKAIPAAAVTSFTAEFERQQALSAGFRVHVSKPFAASELVSTVAFLAGRS